MRNITTPGQTGTTPGRTVINRLQTGAQRADTVGQPWHSGVTPCKTVWHLGYIGMIRDSNRGDTGNTTIYMGLKSTNETHLHGAPGHFHRGTPWQEPGQWDIVGFTTILSNNALCDTTEYARMWVVVGMANQIDWFQIWWLLCVYLCDCIICEWCPVWAVHRDSCDGRTLSVHLNILKYQRLHCGIPVRYDRASQGTLQINSTWTL